MTCGLGLAAVGVLALEIATTHERDAVILHGFTGLYQSDLGAPIEAVARVVDPLPYACAGLLLIAVALRRRRQSQALVSAAVLVGSGVTAQALKHLLAEPRYAQWLLGHQVDRASWPSGHATAVMALALCAVLVAAPAWRPLVALVGGAVALAVAYATLALAWHYPSDVIGGYLVAGLWVSLALSVVPADDAICTRRRAPASVSLCTFGGLVGAVAAAALVGAAAGRVGLDTADRVTAGAGALAIALLVVAMLGAVVMAARDPATGAERGPSPRRRAVLGVGDIGRGDGTPRAAPSRAGPAHNRPEVVPEAPDHPLPGHGGSGWAYDRPDMDRRRPSA